MNISYLVIPEYWKTFLKSGNLYEQGIKKGASLTASPLITRKRHGRNQQNPISIKRDDKTKGRRLK
jgi:hypothetical protein